MLQDKTMKHSTLLLLAALLSLSGCAEQQQNPEQTMAPHAGHGTTGSTTTENEPASSELAKGDSLSQSYDFKISPQSPIQAGKAAKLTLLITEKPNNAPVGDLIESHERLMHVIVISSDMTYFQHVHPTVIGPGKLEVTADFPKPGRYIVFAQFSRRSGDEATVRQILNVGSAAESKPALQVDADKTKTMDGYTFKLLNYPKRTNQMEMLSVSVEKNGKPVERIETYLGAGGHAVVIGESTESFLHVHPATEAKGGVYQPPIEFHTTIPKAGLYKMWAQFKIDGKVRTADFTFEAK
jgi:hypothetical protein